MKYGHIIVIKEWSGMNDIHEMEWLDATCDAGWELVATQFIRREASEDAPHYNSSDKHIFRYVFRTPAK